MRFDLLLISPELILALGGILVLGIGLAARAKTTPQRPGIISPEVLSMLVLLVSFLPILIILKLRIRWDIAGGIPQFVSDGTRYGLFTVDPLAIFFKIIAVVSTAIVILLSVDYFRRIRFHRGEYYALLIFAALAINTLAASTDLIMIYLALEFLSLTSYILVGYCKKDVKSNEAAVKYFLYGSIAGAIMIYGMSILYGMTGETSILAISEEIMLNPPGYPIMFLAMLFILVGFGFKIAMVPFHQWAPDVYEGAPTPITAFLSVGSKAAGFAVLVRVLATGIIPEILDWTPVIMILSGITMTVGNLIAISQRNIKRMLAYSSIAQAGYILLGVAAMGVALAPDTEALAVQSVLLYIFIYLFMNLGAFAVVTLVYVRTGSDDIRDYAGLVKRAPWVAASMFFFLLSLAGIPPTAGFLGKFYLFLAAIETARLEGNTALLWLSIVAIANTVVSVYYYFNVVRQMFFVGAKSESRMRFYPALGVAVGVTLVMTFLVLIFSPPFVHLARQSVSMISGI